jgi:hypothetical protein
MINKKEITQFAKQIIHSQQGLKNRQLMHPRREWLIGVTGAVGIFIACITWSAIEYFEYETTEGQTSSQAEAIVAVYRETLVSEALAEYSQKAERLNALLGESVPVVLESGADTQITIENEGQTKIDPPPEDATSNQSTAEPIPQESVQPATNI